MAYRTLAGAAAAALLLSGAVAGAASAGDYHGDFHGGGHWNRGWDRGWDHRYYGPRPYYYHHHHDDTAAALVGGAVLGLIVGSALADSGPRYDGYYDDGPTPYQRAPAYTYDAAPPPCAQVRSGRTAAGAVTGAVVGGLLGNGVAAYKNREEGAVVGAAAGALIGGSLGNSSVSCAPPYRTAGYPPPAPSYPDEPAYDPYAPSYGYGAPEDELLGGPSSAGAAGSPAIVGGRLDLIRMQ